MIELSDRAKGSLIGLACGDAVGTTLEFSAPGSFPRLTDMVGGGPFNLNPGEWTDDTSMALCLGYSLLESEGFSPSDQMTRYLKWYDTGYLSSNGRCFDIGKTVRLALKEFRSSGNPISGSTDVMSAGNGSLMRLAPVPIFYYPEQLSAIHYAGVSSTTTHGAKECIDACRVFAQFICRTLSGLNKEAILSPEGLPDDISSGIQCVVQGSYRKKNKKKIQGSGYVVESLEAALWAFYHATSFEEAILEAVNLGRDADTTGAICGQLAGAYWGKSGIPAGWLDKLVMESEIEELATCLLNTIPPNSEWHNQGMEPTR